MEGDGLANTLKGLGGNDKMTTGAGADRFVFITVLSATNIDRITDISAGTDQIRLENAVFAGLAAGTLASNRFVTNATGDATTASQRVIYDTATGELFFDADGSGIEGCGAICDAEHWPSADQFGFLRHLKQAERKHRLAAQAQSG